MIFLFPLPPLFQEHVESSLLARAQEIRCHWFALFESFRKLHTQAVLKATYEIFEAVLGVQGGANRLWRYAEQIKFARGSFLAREGRFNHTLYLLQRGRVTTFRDDGGAFRRLRTMSRGAFVNVESLFTDRPVQHSTGRCLLLLLFLVMFAVMFAVVVVSLWLELLFLGCCFVSAVLHSHFILILLFCSLPTSSQTVANTECAVWAISRDRMKQLEAHDPHLSGAILRHILSTSNLAKNRLEREVRTV